jgi:uncharacterized protein (TIGR02246 family)
MSAFPGRAVAAPSRTVPLFLAALLIAGLGACEQTPTAHAAQDAAVSAPGSPEAAMGVVPPGAEREILALLHGREDAWTSMDGNAYGSFYAEDADFVNPLGAVVSGRAAISAVHVFLFGGFFKDSQLSWEIRRLVPLRGDLVLVDLTVDLTGYAGRPPGLVEVAPGLVRTRERMLIGRNGSRWEIQAQQLTAVSPTPPPPMP